MKKNLYIIFKNDSPKLIVENSEIAEYELSKLKNEERLKIYSTENLELYDSNVFWRIAPCEFKQ